MAKNIKTSKESPSGRNEEFKIGSRTVTRAELVKEIEAGKHDGYHVREINGIKTPASNPDNKGGNNLG